MDADRAGRPLRRDQGRGRVGRRARGRPAGAAQLRPHAGPRPGDRHRPRADPRRGGRHRAGLRRRAGPRCSAASTTRGSPSTAPSSAARTGCRRRCPPGVDPDELVALMGRDKKALDGLTFVLDGPAGVEVVPPVAEAAVRAALDPCRSGLIHPSVVPCRVVRGRPQHSDGRGGRLGSGAYRGAVDADRPIVLLLHGPNLNLLGDREPEVYGTATLADHVATTRAGGRRARPAVEALQSNHEGELVDAIHGARRRCAAIIINPGAFTHYAWSIHDALGRLRRPGRRAAPLQPQRPRAVAPHQRRRPGRRRLDRRLRRVRLRAGRPGRRPAARGAGRDRRADPDRLRARGPTPCGPPSTAATLVVSTPSNIRWLTAFGGSLGWVVVGPERMRARHRRPLRRAGGRRPRRRRARRRRRRGRRRHHPRRDPRPRRGASPGGGPVLAEADHLTHAAWTDLARDLDLRARRRHRSPGCGGSRTPASWHRMALAAVDRRRRAGRGGADAGRRADRGRRPRRARAPHAPPRRRRAELRHDRRQRAGQRRPAPPRDRPAHDRRGRHRDHRRRRARRRLPLRHDPHVRRRRSDRASSARSTTSCSRPSSPGSPRSGPAPPAADIDAACRDLFADGRLRRLVPPRHGPRRRPRHPRGSVLVDRVHATSSWWGTW